MPGYMSNKAERAGVHRQNVVWNIKEIMLFLVRYQACQLELIIRLTLTHTQSQFYDSYSAMPFPRPTTYPSVLFSVPPPSPLRLEESTAVGDILSLCFRAAGVSISLCVHPYVCACVCVCVHPIRAKILIACSCFFWVYTAGLCVCISGICLCDSWGRVYTCISASVHQCWRLLVPVY